MLYFYLLLWNQQPWRKLRQ